MLMQNLEGQTVRIMVFSKVANGRFGLHEWPFVIICARCLHTLTIKSAGVMIRLAVPLLISTRILRVKLVKVIFSA